MNAHPSAAAGHATDGSLPHLPCFSRAGPFVFVAGIAPLTGGDIRAQTAAAIETLRHVLSGAGGGIENMVEVTTYLVTMADFDGYNDVYSAFFSPDGPARTTVAVDRLSQPDQLIEMRGTAYIATNGFEK